MNRFITPFISDYVKSVYLPIYVLLWHINKLLEFHKYILLLDGKKNYFNLK